MRSYRIEVGRSHGVQPGNIVGALSNEGKIDSRQIGRINIGDYFSLVDLPAELDQNTLLKLKKIRICEQELQIAPDMGPQAHRETKGRKNQKSARPGGGFTKRAPTKPASKRAMRAKRSKTKP